MGNRIVQNVKAKAVEDWLDGYPHSGPNQIPRSQAHAHALSSRGSMGEIHDFPSFLPRLCGAPKSEWTPLPRQGAAFYGGNLRGSRKPGGRRSRSRGLAEQASAGRGKVPKRCPQSRQKGWPENRVNRNHRRDEEDGTVAMLNNRQVTASRRLRARRGDK